MTYFEKRSIIVKNALFFLIIMNNFTTKFKLISKKDFWEIEINWNSSYDFWFEFFEIWQNEHVVTYSVIFFSYLSWRLIFAKNHKFDEFHRARSRREHEKEYLYSILLKYTDDLNLFVSWNKKISTLNSNDMINIWK